MVITSPARKHVMWLLDNAEAALRGPDSVGVGVDFWGEPYLGLRREAMPKMRGVSRARAVYANLANTEQSGAILREAVFDARAAHMRIRASFDDPESPLPQRPELSIRYVWIGIDWLEASLRSLEGLCVPLAAAPELSLDGTYTLGIWRPDRTMVQVRWDVGTPGPLGALSAGWASLWEHMTDLLRRGEPVVPKELWPLDVPPAYEQAPVEAEAPGDEAAATGRDERDGTET